MKTAIGLLALAIGIAAPRVAAAQATGTASFSAPVRAFQHAEVGAFLSYPESGLTVIEGSYRAVSGAFDVGIRGGGAGGWTMAGFDARAQVVHHRPGYLLDGALIFGAGGQFRHGASRFNIPLGFSLGRRIGATDSKFSVVPYIQPTAFLQGGNRMGTRMLLGFGIGADLRWANVLDLRLGTGTGDFSGVSLGIVWVR